MREDSRDIETRLAELKQNWASLKSEVRALGRMLVTTFTRSLVVAGTYIGVLVAWAMILVAIDKAVGIPKSLSYGVVMAPGLALAFCLMLYVEVKIDRTKKKA